MILMLPPFSHKHLDITHTTHHWPVAIPLSLHIGFPFFIYFLISICIHHACIENTTFSAPSKWFMTKMVITKPVWPTLFIFSIFFCGIHAPPNILCRNSYISRNYEIRFHGWFSGLLIAVCLCTTATTPKISLAHAVHGAVSALRFIPVSWLECSFGNGLVWNLSAVEPFFAWFW